MNSLRRTLAAPVQKVAPIETYYVLQPQLAWYENPPAVRESGSRIKVSSAVWRSQKKLFRQRQGRRRHVIIWVPLYILRIFHLIMATPASLKKAAGLDVDALLGRQIRRAGT